MEGPLKKIKLESESDGVQEVDSVGSEAFANDLVIEEVMKHLPDVESLKNFRFLSRRCSQLGLAALVYGKPGCDHLKATLELTSSLGTKEMEYLKACGYPFKRVSVDLKFFMTQAGGALLRELLVEHLSGMEDLEVKLSEEIQNENNAGSSKFVFRTDDTLWRLTTIRLVLPRSNNTALNNILPEMITDTAVFQRQLHVLPQILEISPRLEEIHGLDQGLLQKLKDTGRWPLVKILQRAKTSPRRGMQENASTVLAEFAKSGPKLVKLKFHNILLPLLGDYNDDRTHLLPMLKSSAESLEKLDLKTHFWPSLEASPASNSNQTEPVRLRKIKSVTMETIQGLSKIMGPEKVVQVLPNLENVIINDKLRHSLSAFFDNGFGIDLSNFHPFFDVHVMDVVFKSVKSVELKCHHLPSDQVNMFPNLEMVAIDVSCLDDAVGTARNDLWCLPPTVEIVELSNFHLKSNAIHGIDALLTGIPVSVCKDLIAKWNKNELDGLNPADFRKMPSVLELPKLKSLRFNCVGVKPVDLCTLAGPQISHLVRWGALHQLPDLRLLFRIPHNNIRLTDLPQVARFLEPVKHVAVVTFPGI